ncbi:MAG: NAD(+) synthase, partial [Sphingomonas sp.]|nr:NAD(+) synthase [Sphingomonas sp.]
MARPKTHRFHSIHAQEMVRVAATTPRGTVGDPAANARSAIDLVTKAAAQGVDLIVFPELSLSSYAIDDLHMQAAQQNATEAAIASLAAGTAKCRTV